MGAFILYFQDWEFSRPPHWVSWVGVGFLAVAVAALSENVWFPGLRGPCRAWGLPQSSRRAATRSSTRF